MRWLSLLLLLCACGIAPQSAADTSVPQVYDAAGKAAALSRETLREVFFMRLTTWPDGSPIKVFVLPDDNPLHIQFAKQILGVFPFQLRSAWDRLVYSGTGFAPTVVESEKEMRERVDHTPGSIGYVEKK